MSLSHSRRLKDLMLRLFLAAIFLLLMNALLNAHTAVAGTYQVIGAGAQSCGTWISDRSNPSSVAANLDESWVLGFLSGVGFEGGADINPLEGMDDNGVAGWVDNYCRQNPIVNIATASAAFFAAHPR